MGLECGLSLALQQGFDAVRRRLAEADIEPSVGSKSDSYDNVLAEAINGLYKAELIHRRALWRTCEATLEWVSWFNNHRLMAPLSVRPCE